MTHLGAACEDGHFDGYLGSGGSLGASITVDTTAGHFLPPNRCGLCIAGNGSSTSPAAAVKKLNSAQSTMWFGARVWLNANANGVQYFLQFLSPTGRTLFGITPSGNASDPWQVYKIRADGASNLLFQTSSGFSVAPSVADRIDVYINYGNPGTITFYINNVQVGSYTGDVTWDDGVTQIASVVMASACARSNVTLTWSGILIDTADTRSKEVFYRPPTANGDTQQWTGGYANVGNETVSSSSYDTVATTGQTQLYKPSVVIPAGTIVRVVDVLQAVQGDGTLTQLQSVRKIGGTVYNSASKLVPASLGPMELDWETNPATGVAWTPADLNDSGYQMGYESET